MRKPSPNARTASTASGTKSGKLPSSAAPVTPRETSGLVNHPKATLAQKTALDTRFYKRYYADLSGLSDQDAEQHWILFGQKEERLPNIDEWRAREPNVDKLPEHFSPEVYRNLNPDLNAAYPSNLNLALHYVEVGTAEGRQCELDEAHFVTPGDLGGKSPNANNIRRLIKKALTHDANITSFLARHGIYSDAFVKMFNANDYQAQVGPEICQTRFECIVHFVGQGQYSLIPISLEHYLDYVFYCELRPEAINLDPLEAYRDWLNVGIGLEIPPNSSILLQDLGLQERSEIPAGFQARLYLSANPDLKSTHGSKWRALTHFARHGISEGRAGASVSQSTASLFVAAADRLAIANRLEPASSLYTAALLADPVNKKGLRHYADCLMRSGQIYSAISVYEKTILVGRDNIWTHLNLSSCLLKLDRRAEAVSVLNNVSLMNPGDQFLRHHHYKVAEDAFNALRSEANHLGSLALFDEARELMRKAVDLLPIEPLTRLAQVSKYNSIRRIGIVADTSIAQCKFYRVTQKVEHLVAAGFEVEVFDQLTELLLYHERLPFLDSVIFYRVAALPTAVRAISAAHRAQLPVIYDIDDLIFDAQYFPDSYESYGGLITSQIYSELVTGTVLFARAISISHVAVASTTSLSDRIESLVLEKRSFVYKNALSREQQELSDAHHQRAFHPDTPVRIFYGSGTLAHNEDFEMYAAPALARLFKKFGALLQLVIVGHLVVPDSLTEFSDYIMKMDAIWDRQTYWLVLGGMDINLAVLKPSMAADCKSEIKWMEAAMLKIPSVVSKTRTYVEVLDHGKTALIAESIEDWYTSLETLIMDPATRVAIGERAYRLVRDQYSVTASSTRITEVIRSIENFFLTKPSEERRVRVLLVHVLFPPQAVGGATRVVADNASDLLCAFSDEIDVEVFTTIEGGQTPYALETYSWQGVRVTGITTPNDPETDQRVFDPNIASIFGLYLDRFKPDVVHFHCIQRLTASVCQEARSRNTLYIVTVHDGWWISHSQFLLDENNRLSLYNFADPILELEKNGLRRFQRMQTLAASLRAADRVLAVSKPFAQIYIDCGFNNISVVENGVSNFQVLSRIPSDGKVRLSHIGGMSFHKGFHLLKAALCRSNFKNLELLLIDHAMSPDEEVVTKWGGTSVRIRGKTPQARIAELYAGTDILVAPSVWPESYGLVVREAIQAGCWIIASDRGALSEPITEMNGFVVSVDDFSSLQEVLRLIDSNPSRYLAPPLSGSAPLRTSLEQAKELMSVYRSYAPATDAKKNSQ